MPLTVRRMLPGEERVYNNCGNKRCHENGWMTLLTKDGKYWEATVSPDGGTIIESVSACSVRFKDGSRAAMIQALEQIAELDRVRPARSIARRVLRDAGEL